MKTYGMYACLYFFQQRESTLVEKESVLYGHHEIYWLSSYLEICMDDFGFSPSQYFHDYWLNVSWLPISVIGTAVAFYVGFKNNQAYHRLWEVRKKYGVRLLIVAELMM